MKFIFWSSVRVWMMLALLLAGIVNASAQTDNSGADQPAEQEQKQTQQAQSAAPVAVTAGTLPAGIEAWIHEDLA